MTSTDRLAWLASVLRPAAVLILDGGQDWTDAAIRTVRPVTSCPVLFVGALSTERALMTLRRGVDAIVPPGLSDEETSARILAIIRRSGDTLLPSTRYLESSHIRLDLWQKMMLLDGKPVHLTTIEFRLLAFLMRNGGITLDHRRVSEHVWRQTPGHCGENALRIAIRRLRQKLNDDARTPGAIQVVRGRGYRFIQPVIEIPDEAELAGVRREQVELLDSLATFATTLTPRSDDELGALLVDHLVTSDFAEAAGLHVVNGDRMILRAHRGLSPSWAEAVREVTFDGDYATARAVSAAKPVQVTPSAKTYALTRSALKGESPATCMFIPIEDDGAVRACVGVVRRSPREFDVSSLAYLRAVLALFTAVWARSARAG